MNPIKIRRIFNQGVANIKSAFRPLPPIYHDPDDPRGDGFMRQQMKAKRVNALIDFLIFNPLELLWERDAKTRKAIRWRNRMLNAKYALHRIVLEWFDIGTIRSEVIKEGLEPSPKETKIMERCRYICSD